MHVQVREDRAILERWSFQHFVDNNLCNIFGVVVVFFHLANSLDFGDGT